MPMFRYSNINYKKIIAGLFCLVITIFCYAFLMNQVVGAEKGISDRLANKFIGVWTVKGQSPGFLVLGPGSFKSIWTIRKVGGKLVLRIPENDLTLDSLEVKGRQLSQQIIYENQETGLSDQTTSINIEVVDGLFDGNFISKDKTYVVTGRVEPLYRSARDAEQVFAKKFKAERDRLGEEVKKLDVYKKQIAEFKLKFKKLGSKDDWEKQRNQDLKSLRRQYEKKNLDGIKYQI